MQAGAGRRWLRLHISRGAERQSGGGMKGLADGSKLRLGETRPDQGHASRQAIGLEAIRHGERGKVEVVHEIRVVAEIAVELHRIGSQLVDADRESVV